MKTFLFFLLVAGLAGCARANRWSVAAVRDLSDDSYRRLRVEVVSQDRVPWPLHLSVSAVDDSRRRVESSLGRWSAKQISPHVVAFEFAEPLSPRTKACVLDLKITAGGHPNLHVHHVLALNEPK